MSVQPWWLSGWPIWWPRVCLALVAGLMAHLVAEWMAHLVAECLSSLGG